MKRDPSQAPSPTPTTFSGISNYRNTDSYRSANKNAPAIPETDYHSVYKIYLDELSRYLAVYLAKSPPNSRATARQKLTRLTIQQFHELSTDVYDELMRRKNEFGVPFLPGREDFHPKRNQARQKLATLLTSRFEDLSSDVYFELSRRYPELKENVSPSGLPIGNTGAGQSASAMIIPTKSTMEEEYIDVPGISRSADDYYDKFGRLTVNSDRSASGATGSRAVQGRTSLAEEQEKLRQYEFKSATLQVERHRDGCNPNRNVAGRKWLYTGANMQDPGSYALSSLLAMLNNKKPGSSVTSVITATIIDLTYNLLSMDPNDYVKIAEQLNDASDVNNMLNFILYLVVNGHLSNPNATLSDANWRARRLMVKVIAKTPVVPTSLIVTGVCMPAEHDCIGGGGFGHVYKGELKGTAVALKLLYKSNKSVAFCREALMWGSLKHKFVLPFLGIYEIESGIVSRFFLVSPYMENGTLAQWRKKANPSIAEIGERMMEVAQGIEYIHSEGAIHGDLCAENILLDHNFHVQIADFGLTRLSKATATRSRALHINFAAPELFGLTDDDDDGRTQKSDVYAFGCLYYEVHYDIIPFEGKTEIQIILHIFQGLRPPRRDEPPFSDKAWELIQCCWVEEASERPEMKDVAEWMMVQSDALAQRATSLKVTMDAPQPLPIISPTPGSFISRFVNNLRRLPRVSLTAGPSVAPAIVDPHHQVQSWATWQPDPQLAPTPPSVGPTHQFQSSWATWQPDPRSVPSPPTLPDTNQESPGLFGPPAPPSPTDSPGLSHPRSPTLLVPDRGSPGLFGPRTPPYYGH